MLALILILVAVGIEMTAQLKLVYSSMHMNFILSCGRLFSSGGIRDEMRDQLVELFHGAGVYDQRLVKTNSNMNFNFLSPNPSTIPHLWFSLHGDKTCGALQCCVNVLWSGRG